MKRLNFFIQSKIKVWRNFDRTKQFSIIAIITVLIFFGFVHVKMLGDTFFVDEFGGIKTTLEGYGDIPLHMTQVSKFAYENPLSLNDPIYYGRNLQYHFLFNLIRGFILKFSNSWSIAMLWPAYFFAIINIVLIFIIYNKFTKNLWLSLSSLVLFFLGAGTAGWNILGGQSAKMITSLNAIYPNQNIVFGPVLSMSFIHQQTFILGLTAFLVMILIVFNLQMKKDWRLMIGGILTLAILPLIHMHSFIAINIFISYVIVVAFFDKKMKEIKNVLTVFITGIILALPSVYFLVASGQNSFGSSLKLRLGWMVERGIGSVNFLSDNRSVFTLDYFNFLYANFGLILLSFVIATIFLLYKWLKNKKDLDSGVKVFILSSITIFVLVQFVRFQIWNFDNNKLLVYFLFFASPIIWLAIIKMFANKPLFAVLISLPLLMFLTLSGISDTYYRFKVNNDSLHQIFSFHSIELADYIKHNTDKTKIILTGADHRNPVSSLAGRQILLGYPGWLWTRGINYSAREAEIKKFYADPNPKDSIISKYSIGYVLVDDFVLRNYNASLEKFDKQFTKVFSNDNYTLYSLIK